MQTPPVPPKFPTLPIFPLGTVLFPYVGLPLRIFEPRYRDLTRDCLNGDRRFGIVLIERGSEVGGGDDRFEVGTVARIVGAEVAEDGQALLMTVGEERFRIRRWLDGTLYPRAEVEYFADATSLTERNESIPATVNRLTKRMRRALAMQAELNIPGPPSTVEFSSDVEQCLWQLCAVVPGQRHDDLALLSTPTVERRLALIEQLLDSSDANANRLLNGL